MTGLYETVDAVYGGSRSNLRYGNEDASEYRVHAAARRPGMGGGAAGGGDSAAAGPRRPSAPGYRRATSASRRYRSTGNLSGETTSLLPLPCIIPGKDRC